MERSIIIKELEQYYNQEGIKRGAEFACKNKENCKETKDGIARGMQCHIGSKYGNGERMRVLVASMDCGYGGDSPMEERRQKLENDALTPLNPHMRGTYSALKLFLGDDEPKDLVHYMAMTNTCKCCRETSSKHMTYKYYWNCRDHTVEEILRIRPEVILFQGAFAPHIYSTMLSPVTEDPAYKELKLFKYKDFECYAVMCIHPSACYGRNAKRWKEFYKGTEGKEAILSKIADYIKNQLNPSLD